MKTVERITAIKNFMFRKVVMGPILIVTILVSGLVTGNQNHMFGSWVAKTDAVSSANTSGIVANTKAIQKLQADVANKPPVVIVQKVEVPVPVPAKPAKHAHAAHEALPAPAPEKPHGVLTKLKNFLF